MAKLNFPVWGIVVMSLIFSYCTNPVQESGEDHLRPVGVSITQNDSIVVRYQKDDPVSGVLHAPISGGPAVYHLFLIDADGETFQPADAAFHIEWSIADTAIASVRWPADGLDKFSFNLSGKIAGATTATLTILHEGHTDFTSRALPVAVP